LSAQEARFDGDQYPVQAARSEYIASGGPIEEEVGGRRARPNAEIVVKLFIDDTAVAGTLGTSQIASGRGTWGGF